MLKDTKIKLKILSKEIRELKNQRPLRNRGTKSLGQIEISIYQLKYHFRHTHIAYCELRGRNRDQIEKPAENNKANEKYIEKIKKEILEKYDEQCKIIHSCA